MYTDFIAQAYSAGYEFVTLEDLASRIAAQEKAHIDYTTSGNTITATVTPDPTAPDLGAMALDVVNGGTQVIQSVTNWYAYNAQELFLPTGTAARSRSISARRRTMSPTSPRCRCAATCSRSPAMVSTSASPWWATATSSSISPGPRHAVVTGADDRQPGERSVDPRARPGSVSMTSRSCCSRM